MYKRKAVCKITINLITGSLCGKTFGGITLHFD